MESKSLVASECFSFAGMSAPGRIDHLLSEIKAMQRTAEEVFDCTQSTQAKRYLEQNLQPFGE